MQRTSIYLATLLLLNGCGSTLLPAQAPPQVTITQPEQLSFTQQGLFKPSYDLGPYHIGDLHNSSSTAESGIATGLKGNDTRYQKPLHFNLSEGNAILKLDAKCQSIRSGGNEDAVLDLIAVLNNRNAPQNAPDFGYGDRCSGTLQGERADGKFELYRAVENGKQSGGTLKDNQGNSLLTMQLFTGDILKWDAMSQVLFLLRGQTVAQQDLQHQNTPLTLQADLPAPLKRQIVALAVLMREWRNYQQQVAEAEDKAMQSPGLDSSKPIHK